MSGTYEGDGRTVFAYFGTPQIEPRSKTRANASSALDVMPGDTITEAQLVEIESFIASGLFIGRNEGVAMRLAAAIRRSIHELSGQFKPDMRFIRRLEVVAGKLERAASAFPALTGKE